LQTVAQLLWTADYRFFPAESLPAFLNQTMFTWGEASLLGKEMVIWIAMVVLMVGLGGLVAFSKIGKAMRACAIDKETAALMGVNVNYVIGVTFMIGSAMAAVAGILFAVKVGGNISPRMGYYPGVIAFAAAVLGGIGSIRGAVAGGLLIGLTQAAAPKVFSVILHKLDAVSPFMHKLGAASLASRMPAYDFAFAFGLMILVILFRPWGLFGRAGAKRA
ncbi:MAG: branched-chain amino acid ABC transporter permease, partial [Planctomycetota bacterium]